MKLEAVRRMRLREMLVLYVSDLDDPDEKAVLQTFAAELSGTVRIPIVVLEGAMTLESVSESQMLAAGWVKRRDGNGNSGGGENAVEGE